MLARKLKLLTFSRNWEIRLVFTKGHHHGWPPEKIFLVEPVGKRHPGKKTISEHNIQHTQITTQKFFFFYHKLGWDVE